MWQAVRWNLGPTRLNWTGLVSLDYYVLDTNPGARTNNFDSTLSLLGTASTFVWQPWFIQLNGLLGLNLNYFRSDSDQPASGTVNFGNERRTTFAPTGNVRVGVFPYSRFPFEAFLEKTNSRTDGQIFDQNYDTLRYGLRQRYSSPSGNQTYAFTYDHSVLDSQFAGLQSFSDKLDVMTLTGSYTIQNHSLGGFLEWDRAAQQNGFRSDNYNALLQHFWTVSPQMDVNSDASYRSFRARTPGAGINPAIIPSPLIEDDRTFIQFNSYSNWRSEELPLTAFGTFRYFTSDITSGGVGSGRQDTLDASLAATYNLSRNATVSGRVGATVSDGDVANDQAVQANYFADAIPLGAWQYFWNAGASAAHAGGGSVNGTLGGASLGHNAYRSLGQWGGGETTLSLFQSLSQTVGSGDFETNTVHGVGGSLNWNRAFEGASANAGLSVSDNRSWGDSESAFDLVNLQVGLEGQFTRYSGWSGNLTGQWLRQEQKKPNPVPQSTDSYVNANLTYRHFRAFGVPRLQFTSTLQTFQFDTKREEGNLSASPRNVQWRWDNKLFYPIGKTELEARVQLNRIEVGPNQTDEWLVGVRVVRRLGN